MRWLAKGPILQSGIVNYSTGVLVLSFDETIDVLLHLLLISIKFLDGHNFELWERW